jgi:hypothetical protein
MKRTAPDETQDTRRNEEDLAMNDISLTKPFGRAWERMKVLLFRPFDPVRWFVLGFGAWLATLGEGAGFQGGNWASDFEQRDGGRVAAGVREYWWIILPVALVVLLVAIAVWLLILWLSSRGRFVFLHQVATGRAAVGPPWRAFAREAGSLFRWRIAFTALAVLSILALLALPVLALVTSGGKPGPGSIVVAVGGIALAILWALVLAVVAFLLDACVVPLMWRHRLAAGAAWRRFLAILGPQAGHFTVFALFFLLLDLVAGIAVIAAILGTCCCALCILAIPYIGTVALLPLHAAWRLFSLEYMAQFDPDLAGPPDLAPSPPSLPEPTPPVDPDPGTDLPLPDTR